MKLSVSDNGIDKPDGVFAQSKTGLGTGIVKAHFRQLDAKVETLAGPEGTTVSVTPAIFAREALTPVRAAKSSEPEAGLHVERALIEASRALKRNGQASWHSKPKSLVELVDALPNGHLSACNVIGERSAVRVDLDQ